MPQPNGYTINSPLSDESEDSQPLIENEQSEFSLSFLHDHGFQLKLRVFFMSKISGQGLICSKILNTRVLSISFRRLVRFLRYQWSQSGRLQCCLLFVTALVVWLLRRLFCVEISRSLVRYYLLHKIPARRLPTSKVPVKLMAHWIRSYLHKVKYGPEKMQLMKEDIVSTVGWNASNI